jgi:hypothetical protein
MEHKIINAMNGKTQAEDGLNIPDIKELLTQHGIPSEKAITRADYQALLPTLLTKLSATLHPTPADSQYMNVALVQDKDAGPYWRLGADIIPANSITTRDYDGYYHSLGDTPSYVNPQLPSEVEPDHPITVLAWHQHGLLQRKNGPALVSVRSKLSDARVLYYELKWYHGGKIRRDDGPAIISYGQGFYDEFWIQDNNSHRDGGPV